MANEMFQARLPDGLAEEVHEFKEDRHMSKSEAVRALLRAGLEESERDADAEDQEDARNREGLLQIRAHLAERFATLGTIAALLGGAIPFLAIWTITTFKLSVGEFGFLIVAGLSLSGVVLGAVLVGLSIVTLAEALFTHGIRTGWFSRQIERVGSWRGYTAPEPPTEAAT